MGRRTAASGSATPDDPGGTKRADGRLVAVGILVVALIGAALVVALVSDGGAERVDDPAPADIAAEPALYAGQVVTLEGTVEQVYELPPVEEGGDPGLAFAMGGGGEETLLVVDRRQGSPPEVAEGDTVEVEGPVQGFFPGGFQTVFGTAPAGVGWGAGATERPVVLAQRLSTSGGDG